MKLVSIFAIAIFAVIAAKSQVLLNEEWNEFKIKHNKVYKTAIDEKNHMKIFLENKQKIDEHNLLFKTGKVSYELEVNKFADLSKEEMRTFYMGLKMDNNTQITSESVYIPSPNTLLPATVDWRDKGAVTPVKDQARCGSCWAFSATGSLEGQHFLKTGKLVSLSEQNLVDCDKFSRACLGGSPIMAYIYIALNGGIDTEESYPYEAKEGQCRYDAANRGATCTGYSSMKIISESILQHAAATIGPISVAIDADHDIFKHYKTGVYDNPDCSQFKLNHAVLVVGYGTENGKDYWLVKNSWGSNWGEKGYVKMSRNKNNQCGIAMAATFPNV